MKRNTFVFSISELDLKVDKILRVMGYGKEEAPEVLIGLITDILEEVVSLNPAKAEYALVENPEFNNSGKRLKINDVIFSPGGTIYGKLRESQAIAIFLATAGEEIGLRSRRAMNEGELLTGYIYDIVGSEIVEAVCGVLQDHFDKEMALRGWLTTNMYSPGYCEWDVADQHKLFRLFPDNFCNIKLTTSALMDPVKSASGLIGAGLNVKKLDYTCSLCDREDCTFRRSRFQV